MGTIKYPSKERRSTTCPAALNLYATALKACLTRHCIGSCKTAHQAARSMPGLLLRPPCPARGNMSVTTEHPPGAAPSGAEWELLSIHQRKKRSTTCPAALNLYATALKACLTRHCIGSCKTAHQAGRSMPGLLLRPPCPARGNISVTTEHPPDAAPSGAECELLSIHQRKGK